MRAIFFPIGVDDWKFVILLLFLIFHLAGDDVVLDLSFVFDVAADDSADPVHEEAWRLKVKSVVVSK